MSLILSGKDKAQAIYDALKHHIAIHKLHLTLKILQIGENEASSRYIEQKKKWATYVGITCEAYTCPSNTSFDTIKEILTSWNNDPYVTGIIIQLPLPEHIALHEVVSLIDPSKDVDGLHPYHQGMLFYTGNASIIPCTPKGILYLCDGYSIDLQGKHVVILGTSTIVGKPLALLLLHRGATVTLCNKNTRDIFSHVKRADVLILATGVPKLIDATHLIPETVVIDVGFSLVNGKVCGDADFDSIVKQGNPITPVPGGIGPLTVACVMENVLACYALQPKK